MKTFKLIILILCVGAGLSYGQAGHKNLSTIRVRFHYPYKKVPDSLSIWSYPNANYRETSVDFDILKNEKNEFDFIFPVKVAVLNYRINMVENQSHTQIGNYFTVPGDQISLDIYETKGDDSLVFSGRGSSKYRLITSLIAQEARKYAQLPQMKTYSSAEKLQERLENTVNILKGCVKKKQELINAADPKMGKMMKEIISSHYANYGTIWTDYLMEIRSRNKDNATFHPIIAKHFNSYYKLLLGNSTVASTFSHRHFQLLLGMLRNPFIFNNQHSEVDLKGLYDVAKNYSTIPKIRDRLLCEFFETGGGYPTNFKQTVFDSLLLDAVPYMTSPAGKEFMATNLLFKKGKKLFDAEFTDLKGNKFKPSDLKGKVFLIDAWGEGCGGCVMFHEWFETNLWPELKDLKDFVVLSIFDGLKKEDWARGIASKRYTSDHYLNVSDIPVRMADHPFFKYYKVNALPFLLLVDKNGNVVQKFNGNMTKDGFLKLLKDCLESPYPI